MKDHEQADIVRKLSSLIVKAVPKAQAINKYGGTLYTLKPDEKESQFCGIFQYKNHVQLAFSQLFPVSAFDKVKASDGFL